MDERADVRRRVRRRRTGALSALALAGAVHAQAPTPPVRVIDGDTVAIGDTHVRIGGIDAPESAQRCAAAQGRWACGQEATRALRTRIAGKTLECEALDRDRYGRVIGRCTAGGEDIGQWMVREGWALAYRAYSTRYASDEAAARQAKRGVWRGEVMEPWRWRRGARLGDSAREPRKREPGAEGRRCAIKGNVSTRTGEKIYHVPGGQWYESTRIDPARGERWFCSESEARRAGWRKSRR